MCNSMHVSSAWCNAYIHVSSLYTACIAYIFIFKFVLLTIIYSYFVLLRQSPSALYAALIVLRHGFCEVLISDQGREFVNQIEAELFRLSGIEHRITTAYHPQTNGLTERFNQTLQTALLKVVNDTQSDWDYHLPAILFAYRTSIQKATKFTPFSLMYCRYVKLNHLIMLL